MRKYALVAAVIAASAGAPSAIAEEGWTKTFVIDWLEPAMYYGAPEPGDSAPGTDCPAGPTPENDWVKLLSTSWRTKAEVARINDPEDPQRIVVGGLRTPHPKKMIYQWPWLLPDPGLQPVTGPHSYGFDLDNDTSTGFPIGMSGDEKGVDNEYYRAIGCVMAWRGSTKIGHHAKYVMDGMRDGSFTVLAALSGEGDDWRNDPNARMAFYMGKDKMVKDANGEIAEDYTFRINPSPDYESSFPVSIKDGVITHQEPGDITFRGVDGPVTLMLSKLNFEVTDNGHLHGFIGGYQDVDIAYNELARGGATYELTMRMNTQSVWYALLRHADGLWDEEKGRYTGISKAYRFYGTPAIVIDPEGSAPIVSAAIYDGETEEAARRFPRSRFSDLIQPEPEETEVQSAKVPNIKRDGIVVETAWHEQ